MKLYPSFLLGCAIVIVSCTSPSTDNTNTATSDNEPMEQMAETANSLKEKLDAKRNKFNATASEEKKTIYANGIEAVANSGILESALNVGNTAPDFKLNNATGKPVQLYQLLENGPVILTWYRGGWCPYCNITLAALQESLPEFEAQGATLLALTPELPDKSMSTAEKHQLDFEVLSDINNTVAKEYGVVFELTPEVAEIYQANFDLHGYNGNESNELPLAATYIISQQRTIEFAFLHPDYRNRAEPNTLLKVLKRMRSKK